VLILTQDGYAVCAERAIGLEIVLGTTDGTPRSNGLSDVLVHMDIVLMSVQYRSTVCTKRTVGLVIILDPPDGTPA
jgi:hypothetical protein